MYARISTLHVKDDVSVDQMRESVAGSDRKIAAQEGCIGSFALGDPVSQNVHMITFWRTAEDLIESHARNTDITRTAAEELGGSPANDVVRVLEVLSIDLAQVVAQADRSGISWPLIERDEVPPAPNATE
ncbi:MAG TPA: hypothetical protein VNA14_07870 [Mycobacteriales bacterium]|nr:hypothetical protein [Mycobacteriales bacterium]